MVSNFHFYGYLIALIENDGHLVQLNTVIGDLMHFDHRDGYFDNLINFFFQFLFNSKIFLGISFRCGSGIKRSIKHINLYFGILGRKLREDFNGYLVDDGFLFTLVNGSAGVRLRKVGFSLIFQLCQYFHLFIMSDCDIEHFTLVELPMLEIDFLDILSQFFNHFINRIDIYFSSIMLIKDQAEGT